MKILLIASLMVMVSAPVMAGKFGFSKKDLQKIKQHKLATKVETIKDTQPGLVAIKPLAPTKATLIREPASDIQYKAELIKFRSQERLAP